jgi:hypothetical protein
MVMNMDSKEAQELEVKRHRNLDTLKIRPDKHRRNYRKTYSAPKTVFTL